MNYDNPAARLLAILEKGKNFSQNITCRNAWRALLDVGDNQALLMSRLGKVMELLEAFVLAMKENYPSKDNTWAYCEKQLNGAFLALDLHASWATFINQIDDHSMNYLNIAAELLETKNNTKLIHLEDITQIRDTLNQILSDIMEDDVISSEVKKYVVRSIRKIIISIDEYKLTGAVPILDSVESAVGHAHVDKEYKSFLTGTELGNKFSAALGEMANIITVVTGLPQISPVLTYLSALV